MNKKIIYLSVFLVLALFLVSACNQAVGKRVTQKVDDNNNVGYGTTISGCKVEYLQNMDFVSDNINFYPFNQIASNEDKSSLSVASVFLLRSDTSDQIKLTKIKGTSKSTVTTEEAWLYYRKDLTPIYPAVIFYKDHSNSNKKSIFWNVLDEDETPYISC